jgi:hypothetical protein
MRYPVLFSLVSVVLIAGCGGGGDGDDPPSTDTQPPTETPRENQLDVVIDGGPVSTDTVNVPYASATVCYPGTNNCKTIDHLVLDTGSAGLRIMSSALASLPALPPVLASDGKTFSECVQFVSGYTWGPIRSADVKLAGHTLDALSIHVIDDTAAGDAPEGCKNTGVSLNTVRSLGGNGILGVGAFAQDCGSICASAPRAEAYYACSGASCQPVAVARNRQVHNPVALLSSDNNGVVVELPAISSSGASPVRGTLTLGIGTQSNNSLGNATVIGLNTIGEFTTNFNGTRYRGIIDSGSNGFFFADNSIPRCSKSGFYCPASVLHLSATNTGSGGATSTVDFQVDNAQTLFSSENVAFNNLAGTIDSYFDWGLPFFFGRKVFTAIEGRSIPSGDTGPFVAYREPGEP